MLVVLFYIDPNAYVYRILLIGKHSLQLFKLTQTVLTKTVEIMLIQSMHSIRVNQFIIPTPPKNKTQLEHGTWNQNILSSRTFYIVEKILIFLSVDIITDCLILNMSLIRSS